MPCDSSRSSFLLLTHHYLAWLNCTTLSMASHSYAFMYPSRLSTMMEVLETLFQSWSAGITTYEHIMLWATCLLGFLDFLHAGEFTVVLSSPQVVLSSSDIRVDCQHIPTYLSVSLHGSKTNPYLSVSLRGSKTDPFGEGCTLYIGQTNSRICQ